MGEKDFQQFFLIKRYLEPLHDVKIINCKTIRNKKYLPFSSRNLLLSKKDLSIATLVSKRINHLSSKLNLIKNLKKYLLLEKKFLEKSFAIKIDYLEVRNAKNLKNYQNKLIPKIFIAYYINKIRLIDNF